MIKAEERAPPGRREARKQERREAIIAIAAQSFLELGYAGTSMSAIAAELGGSKGTLWSYFPSKEALFDAVIEDRVAAYREELGSLLATQDDLRETVMEFCRGFIRKVNMPDAIALHRLVSAEAGRFPEVGRIFYERAPRITQMMLARFFAEHMANGHLRQDSPELAARALSSLCLASQHETLWGRPSADAQKMEADARFAAEAFLRAFAP